MNKVYPIKFQHPASIEKAVQHCTFKDFVILNTNVKNNPKYLNGKKSPQTYQQVIVTNPNDITTSENMTSKYGKIIETKTAWSEIEMNDLSDSSSALSDDGFIAEPLLFKQKESLDLNLQSFDDLISFSSESKMCLDDQPSVQYGISNFRPENSDDNKNKTILLTDITGRTYKMPILVKDNDSNSDMANVNNKTNYSNANIFKKNSVSSSISRSSVDEFNKMNTSDLLYLKNHIDNVSNDDNDAAITGSLTIDVKLGLWTSDIRKNIDIQMDYGDWSTEISELSSDLSKLDWKTTLLEITQFKSAIDWQTSIKNIKDDDLNHQWVSKFADGIQNTQSNDWITEIKKIENMQANNSWTTVIRPIEKYKSKGNEWITKINSISKNTEKDSWKVKLSKRLKAVFMKSDWKMYTSNCTTKFAEWKHGAWKHEHNNINVENRATDWSTVCKSIEPHSNLSIWNSKLTSIEPVQEDNSWIIKVSNLEKNHEKDIWNMKLTDIEKDDKSGEWNFNVKDVPSDDRQVSDWLSTFKSIDKVFPEDNSWSTTKNDILPKNEVDSWNSTFFRNGFNRYVP